MRSSADKAQPQFRSFSTEKLDPTVKSWLDNIIIPNLFDEYMRRERAKGIRRRGETVRTKHSAAAPLAMGYTVRIASFLSSFF